MKALVFNGPRDIRYERVAEPKIQNDRNLIIKVNACSICGSDLHMYHGGHIGKVDYGKPMLPFCTGHETVGEVVETGTAVLNHRVGDRILVAPGSGCGQCRRCRAGQVNICEKRQGIAYGISANLQGGHAEYLEVRFADDGAATIPEGVTDEQALLLTDALATGYYGVKMAQVSPGDTVAVIGQGPVGLMAAEAAMAVGAARVFTIDPVGYRRLPSTAFGATALHPDDAGAVIKEATKGIGVDAVIEAVGAGPTVNQAIKLVRLGGRISVLGVLQADTPIPMHLAQQKSVMVHAGIAGVAATWSELVPLVQAGRIKGQGLFTHRFSLSEGAEAFRLFDAREDQVVKILMKP